MGISHCLIHYLDQHQINFDLISHRHTDATYNSARSAHIPVQCMVKGVLLHDKEGCLMVAVPSTRGIDLDQINQQTGRHLQLAQEEQLSCIFNDCEVGAVPALGEAFGIPTLWDERLCLQPSFYIEAGDHRKLVRLGYFDFMSLVDEDKKLAISH
jgi:Ala-tRNA(Pro) deacylase